MRQLLLLIVVFFASQWLFKKLRRAQSAAPQPGRGPQPGRAQQSASSSSPGSSARPSASRAAPPQLPDPLIRCAQCGVHTPRSESIVVAGQRFCSADHAKRFDARPTGRDAR
jgi:uncharacterized protein